ncbi:hypothetical protein ACB098_04G139100 [Castanea mollissima]
MFLLPYIAEVLLLVKTIIFKEKAGLIPKVETALLLEFSGGIHTNSKRYTAWSCKVCSHYLMEAITYGDISVFLRVDIDDVEALTTSFKRGVSQVPSLENILTGFEIRSQNWTLAKDNSFICSE